MTAPVLERIESDIEHLSLAEQLFLMERLARRIRERTVSTTRFDDDDLTAMAADPDIQRELSEIEMEFAPAELDGLESSPCP